MALSSDEADYIAFCKWIVDQPAETALLADRSIKACLLRQGVVEIATLPTEPLARELDEGTAPDWFPPYGWASRALLAYRNGDSESAVKYVNQSDAHNPSDFIGAMNQAILAMAQHELKHFDAAESAHEGASQLIIGLREIPGNRIHPDLMIAEILFREAEVKIKGNDAPSTNGDRKGTSTASAVCHRQNAGQAKCDFHEGPSVASTLVVSSVSRENNRVRPRPSP